MAEDEEQDPRLAELADNPNLETAVFGREVEEFVDNDRIGAYIIAQAKRDIEEAQGKLLTIDPTDSKSIADAQLNARVAMAVTGWLRTAIQNGLDAQVLLQQERDTDGT
jgi:hypothetical protein